MKKTLKIGALVLACAVITVGYLFLTCPTEDEVDERLYWGRVFGGQKRAQACEVYRVYYNTGAATLNPMYIYHHYGVVVVIESEGHPIAVFYGKNGFYEFQPFPRWLTTALNW